MRLRYNVQTLFLKGEKLMNLGGLGLYRKTTKIIDKTFGRTYEPEKYWHNRGQTHICENFLESPNDELIQHLKTIKFDSVLEFGCGWGRVTKTILDNFKPHIYTAFDFSHHQVYNAKLECKNYNVNFQSSSIERFESDIKFDLVIGVTVLLHVLPKDIKNTIKYLLKFSKKYFIHVDPQYQEQYKTHRTSTEFRHNYQQIYNEIPSVDYSSQKIDWSVIHIAKQNSLKVKN